MYLDKAELIDWIQTRWANFLDRGQAADFQKGQILFYEGHRPLGVYLLCRGEIALRAAGASSESAILLTADQRPIIGIDFLTADLPYPFTAQALSRVRVVFINRTDFLQLLAMNPSQRPS